MPDKKRYKHVLDEQPARRITEMWAFIAIDEGGEGIPAISLVVDGTPMAMPLVGADMARMNSLREAAQRCANETGKPVTLAKFSARETLEVIHPDD